jgi:PIN domain nuclease of toxin-antitoxin system
LRVLLDTQVLFLIGLQDGPAVPPRVGRVLDDPYSERFVSSVSIAEIVVKIQAGKIKMLASDLEKLVDDFALRHIAFNHRHAERMLSMPLHHPDPFDRMIIATALAEDITLVGSDRNFTKYRGLKTLW